MPPENPEDPMNNTGGTDEETIAAQRKRRLRRVSFADREITSVHIFKRDEEDETPSNSPPSNASESDGKVISFFSELAEGDDDAEDDDVMQKAFLRPKGSPSSGGSTIGSATSDDDDDDENFFGPVSSHFINPGRLSDATTMSEEQHHDITMDSTAFSMHFRSIARSESGEVKTPTSSHLPIEEKTPTLPSETGSAMVLTNPKKLFPISFLAVDKVSSGGGDSNDMSIVGENSRKYDYGHISSTLAALLGDETNELPPHASSDTPIHQGSQGYMIKASFSSSGVVGVLPPRSFSCVTPSPEQGGSSFMSRETLALVESLSTIQKSKSRLRLVIPPSSPGSLLSQRIEKSKLQLSGHRSMTTPTTTRRETHADIPITNLEDLLSKHDNRSQGSEKKGTPDRRSSSSPSRAVDSSEGNTNFEIDGSLLKLQETNKTGASTPDKFVSSLANSPNAMTPAMENVVTLHDQEQHRKAVCNSESGDGNVSNDSLFGESNKTGFLNGSAIQKEKDSVTNKDQNRTNGISVAYCETEFTASEDFLAVVIEELPGTPGSLSMYMSKNEGSHAQGPSRLKRKDKDVGRSCSPKVRKRTKHISNPVVGQHDENYDANDCPVVRKQVIKWEEIPGKISEEINQILAPLADKLNTRKICKLEDILPQLKKVQLSEMLVHQIQSQKARDDLSGAKTKRLAECRTLLCKLAYEKARLELLNLKKEKIMKKVQAVSTCLQRSEALKLNCAKLRRPNSSHSTELSTPKQAHEVGTGKGAELTKEIKVLDSKINNLVKCFHTGGNMTGKPSVADTIKIAQDNLQKKMGCRSIRQEILVWKVDNLGETNGCQSIVLNYSGLITQRLTLKPGHPSCVLISNSLSDAFIKRFPSMNVSVAFSSLFNAEYSKESVGSSTLMEITQKYSLLVHNLLNVAEELQSVRMEIPNLVQGNFISPSAEQLHLQIGFIDCKSLRKLTVTLDMACLTHGVYPGGILPCELNEVSGTKGQLMNEIESAMEDVGVGYPRIVRLCCCISKLLQSQSTR